MRQALPAKAGMVDDLATGCHDALRFSEPAHATDGPTAPEPLPAAECR
jgi:hypothetical protein